MSIEHKTPNQIISQVSDEVAEMVARWDGSFYEHTTQDEVASMFHHFFEEDFYGRETGCNTRNEKQA